MNADRELLEALRALQAHLVAVSDSVIDIPEVQQSAAYNRIIRAENEASNVLSLLETRLDFIAANRP